MALWHLRGISVWLALTGSSLHPHLHPWEHRSEYTAQPVAWEASHEMQLPGKGVRNVNDSVRKTDLQRLGNFSFNLGELHGGRLSTLFT